MSAMHNALSNVAPQPHRQFDFAHHARIIAWLPSGRQSAPVFQARFNASVPGAVSGVDLQLIVHGDNLFIANFAPEMQRLSSIYVSFVAFLIG
jgi:hypothetical protein